MVKVDYDRDYYKDLELEQADATPTNIKAQFKKLALKWHPDRNHGKEEEAKTRFVIIQAAQEVLLDPAKKAKYDTERRARSSRHPMASGRKGNPYSDVSNQYPRPPQRASQRPPMPTRPATSGASRWTSSSWTPPQPDLKAARPTASDNVRAWDQMRPSSASKQTPQASAQPGASTPGASPRRAKNAAPQPPPRSQSQRQKFEASFGAKKTSSAASSTVADEPPASSKLYNTTRTHTSLFDETPTSSDRADPLSQMFSETFITRTQRPYTSHHGEKINVFEGVNHAKSLRDGLRGIKENGAGKHTAHSDRPRSASFGESEASNSPTARNKPGPANGNPSFVFTKEDDRTENQAPGDAYAAPKSAPVTATFAPQNGTTFGFDTTKLKEGFSKPQNGQSVYESPFVADDSSTPPHIKTQHHCNYGSSNAPRIPPPRGHGAGAGPNATIYGKARGNGHAEKPRTRAKSNPVEQHLNAVLWSLICNKSQPTPSSSNSSPSYVSDETNLTSPCSFSFPIDDSTFQITTPVKSGAETINTHFVPGQHSSPSFQFNAGGTLSEDDGYSRAKRPHRSRMRTHRSESPLKKSGMSQPNNSTDSASQSTSMKQPGGFDADLWTSQIGPENFVPPRPAVSPTRNGRPIKKPKGVKMTAGTAGLVDEDTTSGEDKPGPVSTRVDSINGARSPNAMDIDTPPPEPFAHQSGSARNIPVEPSRPEWRPGNLNKHGTSKPSKNANAPSFKATVGPSEDNDDFFHPESAFADFGSALNVEPLGPSEAGLSSFGDMKSSLPFESQASAKIHLQTEEPKPVNLPPAPKRPPPPAALAVGLAPSQQAWAQYAQGFNKYMSEWATFNEWFITFFATNQVEFFSTRNQKGLFPWVDALGDEGIERYKRRLLDEKQARHHWEAASIQHDLHVRDFAKHRNTYLRLQHWE